jgi:hypothetical protein
MPIPQTFKPLISRLIEATNSKAISWTEGGASITHTTSLSNFTVRIQNVRAHGSAASNPPNVFPLLFSAIDEKGQIFDQFQLNPGTNDSDYAMLLMLYDAAHRSSRQIDQRVASMVKELEDRLKK